MTGCGFVATMRCYRSLHLHNPPPTSSETLKICSTSCQRRGQVVFLTTCLIAMTGCGLLSSLVKRRQSGSKAPRAQDWFHVATMRCYRSLHLHNPPPTSSETLKICSTSHRCDMEPIPTTRRKNGRRTLSGKVLMVGESVIFRPFFLLVVGIGSMSQRCVAIVVFIFIILLRRAQSATWNQSQLQEERMAVGHSAAKF
jgi:hypothetical protein